MSMKVADGSVAFSLCLLIEEEEAWRTICSYCYELPGCSHGLVICYADSTLLIIVVVAGLQHQKLLGEELMRFSVVVVLLSTFVLPYSKG